MKMVSAPKESYYLNFNQDEIFKSLIAVEGHFRNVDPNKDQYGMLNCAVKHLADGESHADEAISHALIVKDEETSKKFHDLRNEIKGFRKKLQEGDTDPVKGIREVRRIRRSFESFNPEYNVSKCESCGSLDGVIDKIKALNSNSENGEEKVLNTKPNNSSLRGFNMENVAVMYGGNFLGKLIDPFIPTEQKDLVTGGLAVGLPLLSKFGKLEKTSKALDQTLVVLGAYEATNLVDVLQGMLGFRRPVIRIARPTTTVTRTQVTRTQPVGAVASKYVVT